MSPDSPRGGSSGGGRPRDEAPAAMTTATSASSAFPVSSSAHTGPDGFDAKQWLAATASDVPREGRTNRLILLHGPNGSAKSTCIASLQRGMEHYSTLDEGALYRFNWIFPSQKLTKGGIGFSGGAFEAEGGAADTYAYLE